MYKMKKKEIVYFNGLTEFDIERATTLIDSVLLCIKARLYKTTLRDIVFSVYNTIKVDLEKCIERNKEIRQKNLY